MGLYITALVSGGIIGRVGIALATTAFGWRWPIGALSLLPAAGAVVMARTLPEAPVQENTARRWDAVRRLARNRGLQQATAAASALFFAFVGVFSFVDLPPRAPAVSLEPGGRRPDLPDVGARRARAARRERGRPGRAGGGSCSPRSPAAPAAVALSLPATALTLIPALALLAAAMFCGVTAAQLGSATSTSADRGVASAMYFSVYYASGALGGSCPGSRGSTGSGTASSSAASRSSARRSSCARRRPGCSRTERWPGPSVRSHPLREPPRTARCGYLPGPPRGQPGWSSPRLRAGRPLVMTPKRWTLVVVCAATAMLMLDIAVVNTALSRIAEDLDAGLERPAVGRRRLHAGARLDGAHRRLARRPLRPPPPLHGRPGRLHRRLRARAPRRPTSCSSTPPAPCRASARR